MGMKKAKRELVRKGGEKFYALCDEIAEVMEKYGLEVEDLENIQSLVERTLEGRDLNDRDIMARLREMRSYAATALNADDPKVYFDACELVKESTDWLLLEHDSERLGIPVGELALQLRRRYDPEAA